MRKGVGFDREPLEVAFVEVGAVGPVRKMEAQVIAFAHQGFETLKVHGAVPGEQRP